MSVSAAVSLARNARQISSARAFVESGLHRLTELGHFTPARADEIWRAFLAREAAAETLMVTPAVLETVAVKR